MHGSEHNSTNTFNDSFQHFLTKLSKWIYHFLFQSSTIYKWFIDFKTTCFIHLYILLLYFSDHNERVWKSSNTEAPCKVYLRYSIYYTLYINRYIYYYYYNFSFLFVLCQLDSVGWLWLVCLFVIQNNNGRPGLPATGR